MCLTFALNVQLEEDVTVYKFLVKHEDGTICSPYYKQGWVEGQEYTANGEMDLEPCTNMLGEIVENYYHVHGGAFHAYESLERTVNEAIAFGFNYDVKHEIVIGKFIIPKGSKVYRGQSTISWNHSTKNGYQYATDWIKFVGLVSTEEIGEVFLHLGGSDWVGRKMKEVYAQALKIKDEEKNESKGTD